MDKLNVRQRLALAGLAITALTILAYASTMPKPGPAPCGQTGMDTQGHYIDYNICQGETR